MVDVRPALRVASYNVNCAVEAEKHPALRFAARADALEATIRALDADIVCLQELRALPETESPERFLARFAPDYRAVIDYRNTSALSFAQAILYRAARVTLFEHRVQWLFEEALDNGVLMHNTPLEPVIPGVQYAETTVQLATFCVLDGFFRRFTVGNTHFKLREDMKDVSARCCAALGRRDRSHLPYAEILCGDFNFFYDKNGQQQHDTIAETFIDVTAERVDDRGEPASGEFNAYSYDSFIPEKPSPLSAIWVARNSKVADKCTFRPARVVGAWWADRDALPSDHMPLYVDFDIQ